MKKNLLLITLTLLIYGCGYEPIVNNNYKELTIENIELIEKNSLNNQIKKHLLFYSNPGKEKIYLTIDSKKKIKVFSKDSKGNPSNYEMTIIVDVVLKKNNKNFSRSFSRNFVYGTRDNQFDLSQYERLVTRDLIDQIINKINIFIFLDS
tara:strand:- start:435 stop:884 length:450 start_codon:yes stop_codon:yes gene_type:complete